MPSLKRVLLILVATVSAAVFAGAAGARTWAPPVSPSPVAWQKPTPAHGARHVAVIDEPLTLSFRAVDRLPTAVVHIAATAPLPAGATLLAVDGNPATATLTWTPTADQRGDYSFSFTATDDLPLPVAAPRRTIKIHVQPAFERIQLSGGDDNVSRWAYVAKRGVVRSGPSTKARVVSRLPAWTPEWYPNLVLALEQVIDVKNGNWVRIRLAKLPNGSTGWVKRGFLGPLQSVTTRLVVDRKALRATLYRKGVEVYRTIIGVGQPQWPTPRGEFYIREKLTGFTDPMYGPIAFGLNARSAVLTDWPGGGFIGIHGTNQPHILPGRVSHGCVRLRNPSILTLARMIPLGTPVTIK